MSVNVLVGVTGSVASIKLPLLVRHIKETFAPSVEVKVVATKPALHFFNADDLGPATPLLTDDDEWAMWTKMSDPVLHIELRNWADVFVVAPLDANTMAKAANGLCDNLLTCVLRAWDQSKPVVICPAMNTHMWTHPLTARHLSLLQNDLGYIVVDPVSKLLACGDLGMGGMAAPADIALAASVAYKAFRSASATAAPDSAA
ncbi:flavoprotein [Entophlyctis helioformis]|nr:flavoprotein [Entophlyctis helioformis]